LCLAVPTEWADAMANGMQALCSWNAVLCSVLLMKMSRLFGYVDELVIKPILEDLENSVTSATTV
jgi:hypothetical protein